MDINAIKFLSTIRVGNGSQDLGLSYLENPNIDVSDLTFSITGGADKDLFIIDPDTGVLTFNEIAFADNALDFDRDGYYELEITITNSAGEQISAQLSYQVAFDKTLPTLSDLLLGYEVAEDGTTTIILTGKATDDNSGMDEGTMSIGLKHALTGQTIWLTGNLQSISLDDEGNFQLSKALDAGLADGLWYVYYESLEDKAGNNSSKTMALGNSSAQAEIPNALYLGSQDKTLQD